MGFTTVPDALRAAGRSASAATEALRSADCGTPVKAVAGALPGSTAAGESSAFAAGWKAMLDSWCSDAGRHAAALDTAASTYTAADGNARAALPDPHSMHGPR